MDTGMLADTTRNALTFDISLKLIVQFESVSPNGWSRKAVVS